MFTFRQFMLFESATERKIQKGFSDPPVQVDGADVVHHDPESQTTIYHIKHPKGAYTLGSKTTWCTATPKRSFAHEYLNAGNLFTIVKGARRYNYYTRREQFHHHQIHHQEFRDEKNKRLHPHDVISPEVNTNIDNIAIHDFKEKWKKPPHPIATMPEKDAIREIKSQTPKARLISYKSMVHGVEQHPNQRVREDDEEMGGRETAIASRFNEYDLHHFHDDTHLPNARFVAHYGDLDKVAHKMKDHPDPEVQKIIKNRVSRAGGEGTLISQPPESSFSDDPNQLKMKLSVPRKSKG
jgi:hypothetical protein